MMFGRFLEVFDDSGCFFDDSGMFFGMLLTICFDLFLIMGLTTMAQRLLV